MSCFDSSENALIEKLQLFMLLLCLTHHRSICCKHTVFIHSLASFCDISFVVLKCPTHAVSHISKALSAFLILYWWNIISTAEGELVCSEDTASRSS